MPTPSAARVARIRKEHLGRHLFELNRAYKDITVGFIRDHGFPAMTASHLHTLSQLDFLRATPMAALASRIGTSKQAISKSLHACRDLGWISMAAAKGDARAVSVAFTALGRRLMGTAAEAIAEAESAFSRCLGKGRYGALKAAVADAADALGLVRIDRP